MAQRTGSTRRRAATRGRGKAGSAADRATEQAATVTRPERLVVEQPPPDPDYPRYRVEPGSRLRLAEVDPDESEHYRRKKDVADALKQQRERIADLQARLYAEKRRSLLIVLQAMDTGGKDGTIKGVFQGVNPQGCQVWSFKALSNEEADHDFLWRYHRKAPPRGMVGIFNRSHYEDVLIVRVKRLVPQATWRPRVRGHQPVRARADPGRRDGAEVHAPHLQGRAAAAAGEPAGRPRQALEVPARRPQGTGPLG
jgi:hypothetical protein